MKEKRSQIPLFVSGSGFLHNRLLDETIDFITTLLPHNRPFESFQLSTGFICPGGLSVSFLLSSSIYWVKGVGFEPAGKDFKGQQSLWEFRNLCVR